MISLSFNIIFVILIAILVSNSKAEPLRTLEKTTSNTYDDHTRKLSDFFFTNGQPTTTASNLHQTTQKAKNPVATISLKPMVPQSHIFPSAQYEQQQGIPNYQTGYKPACQQACFVCTTTPVRPKPYDMAYLRSISHDMKDKLRSKNFKIIEQSEKINDDGSQEKNFVFNNGLTLYQRFPQAELENDVEGFYLQKLEDDSYMTTFYKSTERDYYAHSEFSDGIPGNMELNSELNRMLQKHRTTAVVTENLLDIPI